jgi:nucleoporin NUP42
MRLRHYEATAAGNMNQAIQEAQKLHEETTNQIQIILNDLNGAVKYVLDGQNEHPNRIDIVEGRNSAQPSFGQQQPAPSAAPAFSKPSSFGAASQGTSTPAFGQPSLPAQNQPAFGKPSGLGASMAGPAFGKPAMLGQTQPAFGRPAFGQPSFGQPSFGQPTAITGAGFANAATSPSPFGQATQPNPLAQGNAPSGFGQPTAFGQAPSQTTASPFSQISNPTAPTTGFVQPSSAGGGFGQPSQTPSVFGQPQPSAANPFSQAQTVSATPSGFGQPATTATAFGAAAQQQQPKAVSNVARASLGPKPIIKVDMGELSPIPELTGSTIRDPATQKLTSWKGRRVEYKDGNPRYLHPSDNKTWVRIFFPDGPPEVATLRDCSDKDENYTPEVTAQYEEFVRNGFFKDNVIPSVPPKSEWVSFDF